MTAARELITRPSRDDVQAKLASPQYDTSDDAHKVSSFDPLRMNWTREGLEPVGRERRVCRLQDLSHGGSHSLLVTRLTVAGADTDGVPPG
jgi:hypothetical protein